MEKDIFLVDADNTLLDFHSSSFLAIKESLASFSIDWQEEYAKIFTRLNDSLWEMLERKEITREKLIKIRFPILSTALKTVLTSLSDFCRHSYFLWSV